MKKYLILLIVAPFCLLGCTGDGNIFSANDEHGWMLVWEDDFDSEDYDHWRKADHTFAKNLARFNPDNVVIEDGLLKLRLTAEPQEGRNYSGAEYRTLENYSFGRYEARMKPARGDGIVSSFFTYEDEAGRLDEIDIEFRGNDTEEAHFNTWTDIADENPRIIDLDFDASDEFHDYAIEWTPAYVRWYMDGELAHETKDNVPQGEQKVMMNIWISDDRSKTGVFDPDGLPAEAQYDYVKFYAK